MKRVTGLLVLITFFSLAATSQELTSGNEVLYEQLKLSVSLNVVSLSHATPEKSEMKRWQGYQGARKISEEDFLSIAGLTDKASKAGGHKGVYDFCSTAGVISVCVASGLLCIWGLRYVNTGYFQFPTTPVLFYTGGIALAAIGGPPNYIAAREAFAIAESYNASLRQRLLSSPPIQ